MWEDHYEAQAVVACFIDEKLDGSVHWGESSTHWKLKLLCSPFLPEKIMNILSFFSSLSNDSYIIKQKKEDIRLDGSNNAWGITSFPTKIGLMEDHSSLNKKKLVPCEVKEGMSTPEHAHIDGGRRGYFNSHGIPPYQSSKKDKVPIYILFLKKYRLYS